MAQTALGGNPVNTVGDLPSVGSSPSFTLTKGDLSEVTAADYAGKRVILNIFPSIDTPDVRHQRAHVQRARVQPRQHRRAVRLGRPAVRPGPVLRRRGHRERADRVHLPQRLRRRVRRRRWPTASCSGLLARAVVVLDEQGKVTYTELVPEIANEPDYDAAIAALG